MVGCDPPLDGDEPLDCHGEGGVDGGRHRHLRQGQQRGRAGGQDLNTAWSIKYFMIKCSVLCLVHSVLLSLLVSYELSLNMQNF